MGIEPVLKTILENWQDIGIGLFSFLLFLGLLYLFLSDKLLSPKTIQRLLEEKKEIEAECQKYEDLLDKVNEELVEARVKYEKAANRIEYLEIRLKDKRERLTRLEAELEAMRRWQPPAPGAAQ